MGELILLKRLLKYKSGSIGLLIVIVLLGTALLAPLIAPHDPFQQSLKKRLTPPSWMQGGDSEYFLGTDLIGRDILSRIIYGARISLLVGVCTVVLAGCFGVLLGIVGGYYGGKIDYWVITLINMMWSFPFILLALVIVVVLGTSLVNVIIALAATSWVSFARIIRGEVMAIKVREFVQAERALGAGDLRVMFRLILPNVSSSMFVLATIEFVRAIIRESFMSFLGVGVPPTVPSWGGMLADSRAFMLVMWWLAAFPGLAIFFTALGVNLMGDGLRDLLDPRIRSKA
jgi:peptide/nickel transport system permease protein